MNDRESFEHRIVFLVCIINTPVGRFRDEFGGGCIENRDGQTGGNLNGRQNLRKSEW